MSENIVGKSLGKKDCWGFQNWSEKKSQKRKERVRIN
jgi:hypothetical protein